MRETKRKTNQSKQRDQSVTVLVVMAVLLFISIATIKGFKADVRDYTVNYGESYIDENTFTLFGKNITQYVKVTGDQVDTSKIGTYTIKYRILGNYTSTVTVKDMSAPEIKLNGASVVETPNIVTYQDPGVTAIDNYDGELQGNNIKVALLEGNSENQYILKYTATDSSGNQSSAERIVNIVKGYVYLTFDDGPSTNVTPQILNILGEYGIKATFFLIGYDSVEKSELVYSIYKDEHTIGLHGYSHDYAEVYSSLENLIKNYQRISDLVSETTGGYESRFIRFPGGSSNTVSRSYTSGIMTEGAKKMEELGYTYFDWNIDSNDAGSDVNNARNIYLNVVNSLHEGDNIVLMHDSGNHQATADALPGIIEYCLENNYKFKQISSNTEPVHHAVNN